MMYSRIRIKTKDLEQSNAIVDWAQTRNIRSIHLGPIEPSGFRVPVVIMFDITDRRIRELKLMFDLDKIWVHG